MTKTRYCEDCAHVEYKRAKDTGEWLTLCGITGARCADERSGAPVSKGACGPKGKHFIKDSKP